MKRTNNKGYSSRNLKKGPKVDKGSISLQERLSTAASLAQELKQYCNYVIYPLCKEVFSVQPSEYPGSFLWHISTIYTIHSFQCLCAQPTWSGSRNEENKWYKLNISIGYKKSLIHT